MKNQQLRWALMEMKKLDRTVTNGATYKGIRGNPGLTLTSSDGS
jgi:hypothetical protein